MNNSTNTADHRSLYEVTGDIKDINTMLVPRSTLATPTQAAALVSPSDDGFMAAVNEMDGLYAAPAQQAAPAQAALADPMQWPLPCDVKVGHVTIPKGCALNTLVTRMQVLYEMGVDAPERPYDRGFRHGYNRRDAEVKGALL